MVEYSSPIVCGRSGVSAGEILTPPVAVSVYCPLLHNHRCTFSNMRVRVRKKTFSNMKTLLTQLGVVHQKITFTSLCQELYTRGGICPSRQCRRQCKIFASGVNFSIFTHFLCFFLLKLLKLGEIDIVKFLA